MSPVSLRRRKNIVKLFAEVRQVFAYRELLRNLVSRDLKVRYKNSALGFLWTLLNPVLYMVVFTIVFQVVLRQNIPYFPIFLLSGLLFPIENIPAGLRWISAFVWGRYYIEIVRDEFGRGNAFCAGWDLQDAADLEPPDWDEFRRHVENGRRVGTPLLLALLVIEASDILFAVDSVPAVFAISEDPFIVYSSNVFAILGMRALYLVLAEVLKDMHYLRYGLAAILALAGTKMLLSGTESAKGFIYTENGLPSFDPGTDALTSSSALPRRRRFRHRSWRRTATRAAFPRSARTRSSMIGACLRARARMVRSAKPKSRSPAGIASCSRAGTTGGEAARATWVAPARGTDTPPTAARPSGMAASSSFPSRGRSTAIPRWP